MKQLPLHNHITARQKSILRLATNESEISNQDVLKNLRKKFGNISRITLVRDLNELIQRQYIVRIGSGRGTKYSLASKDSRETQNGIPASLKRYFWDTDMSKLSLTKHATYIIERILEWGNLEAVKWLRQQYPQKMLLRVLDTSRSISHKSWHFWKCMLSNSNTPIACTQRHWHGKQETAWKY